MIALAAAVLVTFLAIPVGLSLRARPGPEGPPAEAVAPSRAVSPEPASPVLPVVPIAVQASYPPLEPYPVRKPQPLPTLTKRAETVSLRTPAAATEPAPPRLPIIAQEPSPAVRREKIRLDDFALVSLLRDDVPEIKLDAEPGSSKKLQGSPSTAHRLLELLPRRADLSGLPARQAAECQASTESTKVLQTLSTDASRWGLSGLRAVPPGTDPSTFLVTSQSVEGRMLADWRTPAAVSTLEQVLQAEMTALRLLLVKKLSQIAGPEADSALARRAAFDLCEEVRSAAVDALKSRYSKVARATLVKNLRYPWPPVADHAADAIIGLGDKQVVPELVKLVDLPDPAAPVYDPLKKKWFKSELVRVNHLANCLLCHAPSSARSDPLRAPTPQPGEPLPVAYYGRTTAPSIRADIVYLKQDFSVIQSVADPGKWPEYQRFDYMVRRTVVPEKEAAAEADAARGSDYPQRQAVLFAIRELTGVRGGDPERERAIFSQGKPPPGAR
jgi:hypothetical protein